MEMVRIFNENTFFATLKGVFSRFEGGFAISQAQSKQDLVAS